MLPFQKHRGKPLLFYDKCPEFFYVHYTTQGIYSFTSHPKDEAIVLLKDTSAVTSHAGIQTHILTTPELESNALDRSATTLHMYMYNTHKHVSCLYNIFIFAKYKYQCIFYVCAYLIFMYLNKNVGNIMFIQYLGTSRGRGRPKLRWVDNVMKWSGRSVDDGGVSSNAPRTQVYAKQRWWVKTRSKIVRIHPCAKPCQKNYSLHRCTHCKWLTGWQRWTCHTYS